MALEDPDAVFASVAYSFANGICPKAGNDSRCTLLILTGSSEFEEYIIISLILPTVVVNNSESAREEVQCAICIEGFIDEGNAWVRTACTHQFHEQCINLWWMRKGNRACPICRKQN
jgi:hypothetical protein